jgi:electron transfer flavoprotein beta subunit
MKIAVCIKRVPSTETTVRVAADGKTLDSAGVEYILSPFDEIALEEGLKLKEKLGTGEVTTFSFGTAETTTTLRTCLAMGADKGILVKDDKASTREPFIVASALATALKESGFDIIWCGKQAVDNDNAQVGTMLARLLNIPFIGLVTKFELKDQTATVHREVDGGSEILEVKLPAVFSAQKGLNEPRYPSLKGIMAAKKKPIDEKVPQLANASMETVKLEYPPSRPSGRVVGKGAECVPEVLKLLHEETKLI